MKAILLSLVIALLLVGCGEEVDVQEAGVEQDLGLDFKLPRTAPDGSSELFKINTKGRNTLVYHEKWLVSTKAQYAENPALYRKMWKDRKIQNIRNGSALKGLFERGGVLEYVIYDKDGVHLFSFYLYKEDIQDSPPAETPTVSTRTGVRPEVENPFPPLGLNMSPDPVNRSYWISHRLDEDEIMTKWYKHGGNKGRVISNNGKPWTAVVWKPNGEKCPDTNLKDGNGVLVMYNDDGTEKSRNTYKDGVVVRD